MSEPLSPDQITAQMLSDIREGTKERDHARQVLQDCEAAWRFAIQDAVRDGLPVAVIAEAAGISRERVYQIRDGRR